MPSSSLPIRVALMLPRFSRYGGVEQFGYRLACALAEQGYHVDFICARQEEAAPEGVHVRCVGRPPGGALIKLAWFIFRCEQLRYQGKYNLTLSLGKTWRQDITRMGGGPLKVFWEKSEQAFPAGFSRTFKRLRRSLSPGNMLIRYIEQHQFTEQSRVIAVSHLVRSWLLEAHPRLQEEHVTVIYNKPDLKRFFVPSAQERSAARTWLAELNEQPIQTPAQGAGLLGVANKGGNREPLYIGTATTNFLLKGIGPLIQALALLPSHAHLFIAGGRGSRSYRTMASDLGVAERVHFCGKVQDMPRFYQALDVFVLDTFYDACSNAVLEALASGIPAATTINNGAGYFLPSDALIRDPGDPQAVADVIRGLLDAGRPAQAFDWPDDVPAGLDAFIEAFTHQLS